MIRAVCVSEVAEAGLSKGEAPVRIPDSGGLKPKRIIFVDDTAKHPRSVDAMLTARRESPLPAFRTEGRRGAGFRQDMAHAAELADGEPRR